MIIVLHAAELDLALPPNVTWSDLNAQERRFAAASILRRRGDFQSAQIAFMIETNNPNFNQFAIAQ